MKQKNKIRKDFRKFVARKPTGKGTHSPTLITPRKVKHITKASKESLLYPIRIEWSDEDESFVATAPDFPGAICAMDTEEEALSEIRLIITGYMDMDKEHGKDHPIPGSGDVYEKARRALSVTKMAEIMGVKRPTLAARIRRGKAPSRDETRRLRKALVELV